jgi:hypothetical protein
MTPRRLPAPWSADRIPGVVRDANGQALTYVYCRATEAGATQAGVLAGARRAGFVVNIAKLPGLLRPCGMIRHISRPRAAAPGGRIGLTKAARGPMA